MNIIELAKKAGFTDYYPDRLTRFAALVRAERKWVDLTDDEIALVTGCQKSKPNWIVVKDITEAVIAAFKEKNK